METWNCVLWKPIHKSHVGPNLSVFLFRLLLELSPYHYISTLGGTCQPLNGDSGPSVKITMFYMFNYIKI